MNIENTTRDLLSTALSSVFDPSPIVFRPADEQGVRPVVTACKKNINSIHMFKTPLNRNAFLCGCLDFTEHDVIEHVIIGFGHKYSSTSKITALSHATGGANKVSVADAVQQAITTHVSGHNKAECLVFHNHPLNPLNVVFDNLPLASSTDRNTLFAYLLQPLVAIKSVLGGGRVRCYLGENGFVREFRTPDLVRLLESLQHNGIGSNS